MVNDVLESNQQPFVLQDLRSFAAILLAAGALGTSPSALYVDAETGIKRLHRVPSFLMERNKFRAIMKYLKSEPQRKARQECPEPGFHHPFFKRDGRLLSLIHRFNHIFSFALCHARRIGLDDE